MSNKWAFTFGHSNPRRDNYVVLEGTCDEARARMFLKYGKEWAMQYPWDVFQYQIKEYNLTELIEQPVATLVKQKGI